MTSNQKATLFALSAVLLWSTVATAFKIALRELLFYQLLLISTIVSTLIFGCFLLLKNEFLQAFNISFKQWRYSMLMGALNPFLYYLVLLKAYSLLPAYMAQPLNYTWPVVLVFFSAFFLRQKLSWTSFLALMVSFSGVLFISNGNTNSIGSSNVIGVSLAAGSSLIWSWYWILNIKDERPVIHKLFINFLFGSLYIVIFSLIMGFPRFSFSGSMFAAFYIGIFEMGITFLLWLMALQLASRTDKISVYIFLSPFISLIFITGILGEHITFQAIIGFVLIAIGILISKWKELTNFEHGN
ncbi:MAG TPA: DMT family transporter [Bacteroidales bacterium]|nr:DMT family transporter [Bacteroidales bacterium]